MVEFLLRKRGSGLEVADTEKLKRLQSASGVRGGVEVRGVKTIVSDDN